MAEKKKTEMEPEVINPWLKENLNLTQQAAILKADAKLATKMKADAARMDNNAEPPPIRPRTPVVGSRRKPPQRKNWLAGNVS